MEIETWKSSVKTHREYIDTIIEVRKTLKNQIEEHLKSIFNWDNIEYSTDLSVITLSWDYPSSPVIRHDRISDLGMDMIIHADYDDRANRIVVIEIYPFGVVGEDDNLTQ